MSGPRDKYGVNPDTGDVIDPEGEDVGNVERSDKRPHEIRLLLEQQRTWLQPPDDHSRQQDGRCG